MKHKHLFLIAITTLALLILTSCQKPQEITLEQQIPQQGANSASEINTSNKTSNQTILKPIISLPIQNHSCTFNSNCSEGEYCIAKTCTPLQAIYNSTCVNTCTIKEVELTTSDQKSYALAPGKGDYTAAGALEWTIVRAPPFCQDQPSLQVPFKIFKRNYGNVLGDEVILLQEGQTSSVIIHPVMKDLKFTLTLNKITLNCQ